jgi:nucleoid-associated protein YgaU
VHRRHLDLLRGLAALALLLALLVGLPIALVTAVGWPLPTELPTWTAFERTLTRGELDSWTLVKALAVLVWLAWAQLAASAVAELVAILRGRRATAVPSSRALGTRPRTSSPPPRCCSARQDGSPTPPRPHRPSSTSRSPPHRQLRPSTGRPSPGYRVSRACTSPQRRRPPSSAGRRTRRSAAPTWRVQPRDTLWGIAETVLGDGLRWREIHDLNVGRPQPDGGTLRRDDDLIRPGWVLTLPPDATTSTDGGRRPAHRPAGSDRPETSTTTITVEPGDTLWDLAAAHLDDPHRWPELYEENRHRSQPDGRHLTDPDLIHPGWQLTVPAAGEPSPEPAGRRRRGDRPSRGRHPANAGATSSGRAASDPLGDARTWPRTITRAEPRSPRDRRRDPRPAPRGTVDQPQHHPTTTGRRPADDPDGDHEDADNSLVLLVGAGLLAAGAIATLDRIRRAKLRRRQPGQRIVLPKGSLARTEQRVRGLADADTADLLDVVLRSLVAACERRRPRRARHRPRLGRPSRRRRPPRRPRPNRRTAGSSRTPA